MEHLNYIAGTIVVVYFMCYSAHVLMEAYLKHCPGTIASNSRLATYRGKGESITTYLIRNRVCDYIEHFPYTALALANNSLLTAKIDPRLYSEWRIKAIGELSISQTITSSKIPEEVLLVLLNYMRTPGQFHTNDWLWFINGVIVLSIIAETSLIIGGIIAGVFCLFCWLARAALMKSPEVRYNRTLFTLAIEKLKLNNQGEVDVAVGKDPV